MSVAGTTLERPPLAAPIAEAALAGNLYYPQTATGFGLMAGRVVADMTVNGQVTWAEVLAAEPTVEQREAAIAALTRGHAAFGIPHRHSDEKPRSEFIFSTKRLDTIIMGFAPLVMRATADYAAGMLEGVKTIPANVPVYMGDEHADKYKEYEGTQLRAIAELYRQRHGRPRPEALALQGIWHAAADAIDPRINREAQPVYKARLRAMRTLWSEETNETDGALAAASLYAASYHLRSLIGRGITAALPNIQKRTNVGVPPQVVTRFADVVGDNIEV